MGSLGSLHVTPSVSVNCAHSLLFLLPHQKRGLYVVLTFNSIVDTCQQQRQILERAKMRPGANEASLSLLKEMLILGPSPFFWTFSMILFLSAHVSLSAGTLCAGA